MTTTAESTKGDGLDSPRATAIVAALAITQVVGYGSLYYAFAVFLAPLATSLNTSTTTVTGAYTASVLASAVVAVPVGRWLDRHGGRALMTAGSLAGTVLLAAWSQVTEIWQLCAVQIGIGIASAACLYEAAFAVIIAWHTPTRRPSALLALTVVGGFASTIFLPLTGRLVEQYGWRTALLLLAAIQGVLTVPLHAIVLRPGPARLQETPRRAAELRTVLTDSGFWLLALAFTANTAAVAVTAVHLVAALVSWGYPTTFAATVAGLSGILSVTGRLVTTGLQRRLGTVPVVTGIFAVQGVAAVVLAFSGHRTVATVIAVVGFGLGFGVAAIAKPVLLTERYGTCRYATIAAILFIPVTAARAAAPLAAAWLRTTGGYRSVFVAVAATCVIGAAALTAVPRTSERLPRARR